MLINMSPDVVFVNIQVRNILKSSDRFVELTFAH